jgi:hypothetical protein
MFRKNTHNSQDKPAETEGQQKSAAAKPANPEASSPRYPKPNVLLVDLKDHSEAVLRAAGYNVHVGTLGTPYSVEKSNKYQIVPRDYKIPNYAEQEIVIVDLAPNDMRKQATSTVEAVEGNSDYWAKCNHGSIDPRPIASRIYRSSFDTILSYGGVFVVFADTETTTEIIYARSTSRGLDTSSSDFELWSFLTLLREDHFRIEFQQGKEIRIDDSSTALGKLLTRHLTDAHFNCVFGPLKFVTSVANYNAAFDSWVTLATDKYGSPVAGIIKPFRNNNGWVFILPQLREKSRFLAEFLRDILPESTPALFPYAESRQWLDKDEYQVPEVVELRARISVIATEAHEKITALEQEIVQVKEQTSHLRQLLSETGEPLVKAVKTTLEQLGFASVVDADEEIKNAGGVGIKREDLRITENALRLLVEVKGITGLPTDADALQVNKYVMVRMREWKTADVQGLEIINHQKGLSPLGREHENTFREDIIVNAEDQHFGLMTTWDLFRLTRSFLKLGWRVEDVKPLFFATGRIEPVPVHYEFVGLIEHFWEKVGVVGVRLQSGEVAEGDRIAFELPIEFEEQIASSLQVENEQVKLASASQLVGIKTNLSKHQLRNGIRVFRVNSKNN